ncbi:hypothetical protein TeGR_g9126 [Tetraparma gracilis]|uniref:Lumazine-binding domain-containing protein n=1 Tax=Tetraparma gracilis TaxID=2962635 RepID=A0ABQ6MVS9_9STRA|nr:hypothetical protein TeGR_g9126 [Tetraparma gracilis]
MFTGIVDEMGSVRSLTLNPSMPLWDGSLGPGYELVVSASPTVLSTAYLGCSICVSGVCLTATSLSPSSFTAGLAPETLRRTHLSSLVAGSPVNLERAASIGGRNSGHGVQGHVDGVGEVLEKRVDGDSLYIKVGTTGEIMR